MGKRLEEWPGVYVDKLVEYYHHVPLIGGMVKGLNEHYKDLIVGKTRLHGLMYVLELDLGLDLCFELNYNALPYSGLINEGLYMLEDLGVLSMEWIQDKGWDIRITSDISPLEERLSDREKESIGLIVKNYGCLSMKEFTVFILGLYLHNNFNIEKDKLVDVIASIKCRRSRGEIEEILNKHNLLN